MSIHPTQAGTTGVASGRTSRDEMPRLLEATAELVGELLASEGELPGAGLRDPGRLAESLALRLGDDGLAVDEVVARMREVLRSTPSSSSWRFQNQLFAGREPVATVAETLIAMSNVSMYTFKAAGGQILVEREVLRHMAAKVGFAHGEGCFTPGGSIANLVALLLARNESRPAGRDGGLDGAPLAVYTSEEGHYSVPKNAGVLGIGRRNVRRIAVDRSGRMDPSALARQLAVDRAAGILPVQISVTAGTTVRGAFDPIRPIAAMAREYGAWLHVDGAFGGSLILSAAHRHLLDGAELADSFTWDPHKMMGVPLQASVLLVARRGALTRSLDETADYLFQADGEDLNPGHRSIQCGRRNDAFKLWAAWLRLGDRGWDERLGRQMELARRAAALIEADPDLQLAEAPPSINVCFEVRGRSSAAICDRLDREGRLKIGFGAVNGRRVLRLVCVNADLGQRDLEAILGEIKAAANGLPEADNRIDTGT